MGYHATRALIQIEMTMKKALFLLALAIVLPVAVANAQVRDLDVGDIASFGNDFLGKQVRISGQITNTYGCKLPSNTGNRCLEITNPKVRGRVEVALIRDGTYTYEHYKDWIGNKTMLVFTGTVELRETADFSYKENLRAPLFILRRIDVAKP